MKIVKMVVAAALTLASVAHAVPVEVTENLLLIARCETGGKPGRQGRPDWRHRARAGGGHHYQGGLGFLDTSWAAFAPAGYPSGAHLATREQQLTVGAILVQTYGGYSSWPACSLRLGLPR